MRTFKKICQKFLVLTLGLTMITGSLTPTSAYAVTDSRELKDYKTIDVYNPDHGELISGTFNPKMWQNKYEKADWNTVTYPVIGPGYHLLAVGRYESNSIAPVTIKSRKVATISVDGEQLTTNEIEKGNFKLKLDGSKENFINLKPKTEDAKVTITFEFPGYKTFDVTVKGPKAKDDSEASILKDYWQLQKTDEDWGELCQQFEEEGILTWGVANEHKVNIKSLEAVGVKIGKFVNVDTPIENIASNKQAKISFNGTLLEKKIDNDNWTVIDMGKNMVRLKPKKYGLQATIRYEFEGYKPFDVTVKGPEDPNTVAPSLKDFFTLPESDPDYGKLCCSEKGYEWQIVSDKAVEIKALNEPYKIKIGRYIDEWTTPYDLKSNKKAKVSFNDKVVWNKNSTPLNDENWEVIADPMFEDHNHVRITPKKYDLEGTLKFEFEGLKPIEVKVTGPKNTKPQPPIADKNLKVIYQDSKNQDKWVQAEQDEKTGLYRVIVKPGAQRKITIGKFNNSSSVEAIKGNITFTDETSGKLPINGDDTDKSWRFPKAGSNWTTVSSGTTSDRKVILAKIKGEEDIKIELISSDFPENVAHKASEDGILFSHKELNKDGTSYWRTLYGNAMKADYDWKDLHTFKATLSDGTFADITAEDYDTNKELSFGGENRKEATIKFKNVQSYIFHATFGSNTKDATIVIEKPSKAFMRYSMDGNRWFDLDNQNQPEVKDGFPIGKEIEFMPDDGTDNEWIFSGEGNYKDMVKIQPFGGIRIKVTPIKEGNVTLKAKNKVSGEMVYIKFKNRRIKATDLSLVKPTKNIFVGDTVNIEHKVTPADTTDKITWSVESADMGTIDKNGNFTALKPGNVIIKANVNGIEKSIIIPVKPKELVKIYFKSNKNGEKKYLDEKDVMTLKITDSGNFYAEGEDIEVVDWCAKEKYYLSDIEYAFHFWIDGGQGAKGTRFFPRKVAQQPANLIYKKNGKTFTKEFTLNVIPSDIEEIKAYENGKEISPTEVMEVQGRERRHITVKGRKKGTNTFVDIPDTAYDIIPKYNQHIIGSSFALWNPGIHTITVKMKDDNSANFEFKANSNYVPVTGLKGDVPKKWYIDTWASPFDQYTGIRWYDDLNDGYTLRVDPEIASNITLNWEALTPDIAIYDPTHSNGIVPKKAGVAKFKVTSDDNPKISREVEVEFLYKTPLTGVEAKDNYQVNVGESKDFDLTIAPENATEQRFEWTYEGDGKVEIQDVIHTDPTNVNIPKWTTHKMIGKKAGTVKVTGIPYDKTNNVKPIEFTVKVGNVKDEIELEAKKVDEKIAAIGKVTLNSEKTILDARAAYDKLTADAKEKVKNLSILEAAEKELAKLKEADKNAEKEAKAVDEKIAAIGKVTLNSEKTILDARAAYDKLTADAKEKVKNLSILEAAEKELAKLKETDKNTGNENKPNKENVDKNVNKNETGKQSPKTGDNTNMILWLVLLLGAGASVPSVRRKMGK